MRDQAKAVVVFDFDGTLTPKHYVSAMKVVDQAGLLSPAALANMDEMRRSYLDLCHLGQLSDEKELEWLERTALQYIDDRLSPAAAHQALAKVGLRPGVRPSLTWLKEKGIPVAIVSYGIAPFIESVLDHHGLLGYVDQIFACRLTKSSDNTVFNGVVPNTSVVPATKGEVSLQFAADHGVASEDILAVCDSYGDRLLGHLQANRFGLAADEKDAAKIRPVMGTVAISDHFWQAEFWLRQQVELRLRAGR
jgi:HAD superfamily phosphoserine phosphatase-like hydrolase